MSSTIKENAIIKCFKTFKQQRNSLSFHKTQEFKHKRIKVVVLNKIQYITIESLRNQVITTELQVLALLGYYTIFLKMSKWQPRY